MRMYASRNMDGMNRLRGFRLRVGMTQAELAEAIGTTQSHVSEYESGRRRLAAMPALQFTRLTTVLDVSPPLLLEDDVDRPYPDLRDRLHDARADVARLRRLYAAEPDEDTLHRLIDAEIALGWAQRDWEAEVRRATFKDPRPGHGPTRRTRG